MSKERRVDSLTVRSFCDRQAMAVAAATDIADALRQGIRQRSSARVVFASAPSQSDMLAHLADSEGIDWSCVTAFHMDEYIGLAGDAPQRFGRWLQRHLFERVKPGEVCLLEPEPDPQQCAQHYAQLLSAAPIDIVCLGIGVNGHLAFNDPPVADFNDPYDVKIVSLDAVCRQQQVDDQCFAALDEVPARAVTLTLPRLLRAQALFCVVPGAQKKAAVHAALSGPMSSACPASILRSHAGCTLYLEQESDPDA